MEYKDIMNFSNFFGGELTAKKLNKEDFSDFFIIKNRFLSKKNSQTGWEFYCKAIVDYRLLSLILAFLPVSSLK